MPANTFTQWQKISPYQVGDPGVPAALPPMEPFYRNIIDRRLSGADSGFRTQEDFPSGYLGTIVDRQEARSYARGTQRNYQRGVDKGSRVDEADYSWPEGYDLLSGIRAEARGRRHASLVTEAGGPPFVNASIRQGRSWLPRGAEGLVSIDPAQQANLKPLLPPWQ